eukprot:TRINITY_DN39621_c0_g1_i1.p1 TRINITY_DN39621_c0_g1~~TRINITY_DN39621_c0_g1_i1.p1  ORF type:complete len:379 (+),score=76.86 TRINITY_DN39621_c0_g1_i1:76-1212(+)
MAWPMASAWLEEAFAEASDVENEAMRLDREGLHAEAVEAYQDASAKLLVIAGSDGLLDHVVRRRLEQHKEELCVRAAYLQDLRGAPATIPLEDHISEVRLTTQDLLASAMAPTGCTLTPAGVPHPSRRFSGRSGSGDGEVNSDIRVLGAAAAIGGAAGLLLMGPLSAATLGAAAAYATTREDEAGDAARKIGTVGWKVADKAVDEGLKVADRALDEGCKRVLDHIDASKSSNSRPTALQAGLRSLAEKRLRASGAELSAEPRKVVSEEACAEARRMRERYPDRVPVICERARYSDLPQIQRNKFIVPGGMLCGEFKYIIHKQVTQAAAPSTANADQTIYIFVNGITPKVSTLMSELYDRHQDEDGFLHVMYGAENTLG